MPSFLLVKFYILFAFGGNLFVYKKYAKSLLNDLYNNDFLSSFFNIKTVKPAP